MTETKDFADVAQRLARNPLGIIALFIVLVYGVAALVTGFGGSLSRGERLPLIYFLVAFPVLVLAVFGWLVSRHSTKLFAPSDFRDEENYVRALTATASLTLASVDREDGGHKVDIRSLVRSVRAVEPGRAALRRDRVLWVDDRLPQSNRNEREAFEAIGLKFELACSTAEALEALKHERFQAIISDMGRREGDQEGFVLLDALRRAGDTTPYVVYSSQGSAELRREVGRRGGQGATNRPEELFTMVTDLIAAIP